MQDENSCDVKKCGAQTDYIPLGEEVMVYGGEFAVHPTEDHQHDGCNNGVACELQIFPDSGSNEKQELNISFRNFFINVDDVTLEIDQDSTTSFNDAQLIVSTWKLLSNCFPVGPNLDRIAYNTFSAKLKFKWNHW